MSDSATAQEVQFGGQEGALTLEFAPDASLPAGVRCTAIHLTLGPLAAELTTMLGLDAVRVRDELSAALTSADITGTTSFESVEHDVHVRIDVRHGKGTITARVHREFGLEDGHAEFQLTTDQTFLTSAARQLDALIERFPKLLDLAS